MLNSEKMELSHPVVSSKNIPNSLAICSWFIKTTTEKSRSCYMSRITDLTLSKYAFEKLDSRKDNKTPRNVKIAKFMKSKIPKFAFLPMFRKKSEPLSKFYPAIANKLITLNYAISKNKEPIDCNTVLTLCLEMIDHLPKEKQFYLHQIYESALMSENRKMVENLQTRLVEMLEQNLDSEQLPVLSEDIAAVELKLQDEMNSGFLSSINKATPIKGGLEFYYELQNNIREIVDGLKSNNDEAARQEAKELMENLLQQIKDAETMSKEDLRSPMLMENLEETVVSLIGHYLETAQGNFKCS
jgi:hypothetical protein